MSVAEFIGISSGAPVPEKSALIRITWCRDFLRLSRRYLIGVFANCHSPEPAQFYSATFNAMALFRTECAVHCCWQRPQELRFGQRFQFSGGSDLPVKAPKFGTGHVASGVAHQVLSGELSHWTGPSCGAASVPFIWRNQTVEQFERPPYQINFLRGHALTTRPHTSRLTLGRVRTLTICKH